MKNITKQYKVGRAVMFYDVTDIMENTTEIKVDKDIVVKAIKDGDIQGATVQWWQEKPIVRIKDKNVPIVKVEDSGTETEIKAIVKNTSSLIKRETVCKKENEHPVIQPTAVGKVSTKRQKNDITFPGYDNKNLMKQQQLKSAISYKELETVSDLFDMIAKDFNCRNTDTYKVMFSKKVSLSKKIKDMPQQSLLGIQIALATYLMNMAQNEIKEAYIKYRPAAM